MSESKNVTVNLGGFGTLLTLLFIGLKLTHYIDWSWWWVLSPIWISCGLVMGMWIFFAMIIVLVAMFGGRK